MRPWAVASLWLLIGCSAAPPARSTITARRAETPATAGPVATQTVTPFEPDRAAQQRVPDPPAEQAPVALPVMKKDALGDRLPQGVQRRFGTRRDKLAGQSVMRYVGGKLLALDARHEHGTTFRDLAAGDPLSKLSRDDPSALSGDGKRALFSDGKGLSIVETTSGREIAKSKLHARTNRLAFASRGKVVVGAASNLVFAWDVDGDKTQGHGKPLGDIDRVVGSHGQRFITLHRKKADGFVTLYDVKRGKLRSIKLDPKIGSRLAGTISHNGAVAFVLGGNQLIEVSLTSGTTRKLADMYMGWSYHGTAVTADGRTVIAASRKEVIIYDRGARRVRDRVTLPQDAMAMALRGDGKQLAVKLRGGAVRRIDVQRGELIEPPLPHHRFAAMSPGGNLVVTVGESVELWDVARGTKLRSAKPVETVQRATFLDDETFVTIARSGRVERWKADTLNATTLIEPPARDRYPLPSSAFIKASGDHIAVDRSVKGEYGGMRTRTWLLDHDGGEAFEIGEAFDVAFDRHKNLVAVLDGNGLVLYNPSSGKRSGGTSYDGRGRAGAVAVSPDSKLIATCQTHHGVKIWDRTRDHVVRTVRRSCRALAFADNQTVAIGSVDGTMWLTNVNSGAARMSKLQLDRIVNVQRTKYGIFVSSEDGTHVIYAAKPAFTAWQGPKRRMPTLATIGDYAGARGLALLQTYGDGTAGCVLDAGEAKCWGGKKAVPSHKATAIDSHLFRMCLLDNGKPLCWGRKHKTPTPVEGVTGAIAIATQREGGCVLQRDGRAQCFDKGRVRTVAGVKNAVQIAAGSSHGCARNSESQVYCWGDNDKGQLGLGRLTKHAPVHAVRVRGLDDAQQIAAAGDSTCAIRKTGTVVCWGSGEHDQLGDGTASVRAQPVPVPGIDDAKAIALSRKNACVLTDGGEVRCWGYLSMLLDKQSYGSLPPTRIPGVSDATIIAIGDDVGCAVQRSGKLVCWH